MHPLTRPRRAVLALACALSTVVVGVPSGSDHAAADPTCPGIRCDYGGGSDPGGFSAWGAYAGLQDGGDGGANSVEDCWVDPPRNTQDGHVVVHVHPAYGEDDVYDVFIHCMDDSWTDPVAEPPDALTYVIEYFQVEPVDPEDVVARALAAQHVQAPQIRTVPGDGNPGMVGVPTWLMVDGASWGPQQTTVSSADGYVSVTVRADPVDDGRITWHTGEQDVTCFGNGQVEGSCSYTYESSSLGQPSAAADGTPAYEIWASITYRGSYQVYVFGNLIDTVQLGDVVIESDPLLLPVQEAQAINTGD